MQKAFAAWKKKKFLKVVSKVYFLSFWKYFYPVIYQQRASKNSIVLGLFSNFQQNYIPIENATLKHFQYWTQLFLLLETAIKKTEYLSRYFEKIHSLLFLKMLAEFSDTQHNYGFYAFFHINLPFRRNVTLKKLLKMFILQTTTEGVLKKQPFREIPRSKNNEVNQCSKPLTNTFAGGLFW